MKEQKNGKGEKIEILDPVREKLGPIPPFGIATFDFNIRTKSLFDKFRDSITVNVGKEQFSKDFSVEPFILFKRVPLIAAGIVLLMVTLYVVILGVYFYRKKYLKKSSRAKER